MAWFGEVRGGVMRWGKLRFGRVRCGMVRCGRAWLGSVRRGEVRSCYAAYRGFTKASVRCVSIKWARRGLEWHGGAGHGEVRPILGEKNG